MYHPSERIYGTFPLISYVLVQGGRQFVTVEHNLNLITSGACVAQWVKPPTLDFRSGLDLRVVSSSTVVGEALVCGAY